MTNPDLESFNYFLKGIHLHDQHQYGQTYILYTRALQRTFDEKAYNNCGNIQYAKGNYHKGIKKYTQAIIINPNFSLAYNGWGSCLSNLEKYDDAIEKFKKAVEIDNYTLAYLNWSLVLFWQKKELEAKEVFEKGFKKTMSELRLINLYKFELNLVEERLGKAVNEKEKVFFRGRVDGYNWILEMISKKFASEETEPENENESEGADEDSNVEEAEVQQE